MASLLAISLISYLLGSFPTSLLAGRLAGGIDIRRHGSGNAGAANVARVLGWKFGLVVLLVDVAKGFLAVWLVSRLRLGPIPGSEEAVQLLAGLIAIVGHIWPVFSGFRGGKGVGTAAGVLLAVHPLALLICVFVFVLIVAVTRIVSLASMAAAALLPLVVLLLRGFGASDLLLGFTVLVAALILSAHRSNIVRLLSGTEPKLGRAHRSPNTD